MINLVLLKENLREYLYYLRMGKEFTMDKLEYIEFKNNYLAKKKKSHIHEQGFEKSTFWSGYL